jgi:hypothetical protein
LRLPRAALIDIANVPQPGDNVSRRRHEHASSPVGGDKGSMDPPETSPVDVRADDESVTRRRRFIDLTYFVVLSLLLAGAAYAKWPWW